MTKERVCANGTTMSRRTLLTALPASGVALALPADADTGETEIQRLFYLHQTIKGAARNHVSTVSDEDEELERLFFFHTDRIEDEMMALPSTCSADLAAKMIVAHCNGEFSCLSWDNPVWIEARRFVAYLT